MLASKFNGRWEAKHQVDTQGQIFLDYDPYCFKQVLAYLRSKAIERPDRPAPQPAIAPESQAQYLALLQYLGLEEFMGKHWYADWHTAYIQHCKGMLLCTRVKYVGHILVLAAGTWTKRAQA